ncbi:MAG TPA: methyltransferase domain-containing protein [Tepidisphaeraceae bacterium]|jgi:SAM-dependent methyltransferase
MGFLSERRRRAEWMDAPDVDPELLGRSLGFIRRINSLLGYTRATLRHLEGFSRGWRAGERIRIIDLATGSADIPRAILRWADWKGFDVRIVGVDRHAVTAAAAGSNCDPRLRIVRADVFELPFAPGSFDYALTAMFLHHLDDDQVVTVLRTMGALARRGVIVADLLRRYRSYAWISLLSALANPVVRHDARVSVAQAFRKEEVLGLRDQAGLDFVRYHEHFGHRFVLAGERVDR